MSTASLRYLNGSTLTYRVYYEDGTWFQLAPTGVQQPTQLICQAGRAMVVNVTTHRLGAPVLIEDNAYLLIDSANNIKVLNEHTSAEYSVVFWQGMVIAATIRIFRACKKWFRRAGTDTNY